jgi:hypothetical protein
LAFKGTIDKSRDLLEMNFGENVGDAAPRFGASFDPIGKFDPRRTAVLQPLRFFCWGGIPLPFFFW